MIDLNQLSYEGHMALQRGKTIGWEQAVRDTLDIVYPEANTGDEVVSRAELIEKTAEFTGKLVAKPLEPVVFYRPGDASDISHFSALIPKPEQPVGFMSPKDHASRIGIIRVNSSEKKLDNSWVTIHASREIVVNSETDAATKLYMGAGARWIDTSPDHYLSNVRNGTFAAGSEETGQLFDALSEDKAIHKRRLFGALFHVAWLCMDFDAKFPITTAFDEEIRKSIDSMQTRIEAASSSVRQSRRAEVALEDAIMHMKNRNIDVSASISEAEALLEGIELPRLEESREVADSLTENYSESKLENTLSTIKRTSGFNAKAKENYEHRMNILIELAKPYM